jgi:hypothetical protein
MEKFVIFHVDPRYESWKLPNGRSPLAWIGETKEQSDEFAGAALEFVSELKKTLWNKFRPSPEDLFKPIPVSMLCIGVLKPSKNRSNAPLTANEAFKELNAYIDEQDRNKEDFPKGLPSAGVAAKRGHAFPVIGDYNYIRWVTGSTATNLANLNPEDLLNKSDTRVVPRHFEKPRMLLKVIGKDFCELWETANKSKTFVRLSLVKFKHRARWVDLRCTLASLSENPTFANQFGMFLSSGWEDIVLIQILHQLDELNASDSFANNGLKDFLNVKPDELDVQSMLVTPIPDDRLAKDNSESTPDDLKSILAAISKFSEQEIRKRPSEGSLSFGRYDAFIKWSDVSPMELQQVFLHLPAEILHSIEHLVHGVGWSLDSDSDSKPFLFTRLNLTIH